jgi:O-antigen ligase
VAASIKLAPANILLAIAAVLWLTGLTRGSVRRPHGAILWAVAGYVLASVLAAVWSSDPRHSVTELGDLLTLVLVPMAISLVDNRRWNRLLILLAIVLGISSILGLVQFTLAGDPLQQRIRGIATHYMTFSGWTLVVTLLLLGDAFFTGEWKRLFWTLPAVVLGASTLLLGLTRGAWIGLATGLLVALAVHRPRALILFPLAATLLFLILPQPVLNRAAATVGYHDAATRERLGMFETGAAMVRDHPVFGLGPGIVQPAYAEYRSGKAPHRIPHLHNNIIQIAAERGVAGLLAYGAILFTALLQMYRALRTAPHDSRPAIVGCLMAAAGVTIAGFFEYNWGDAEVWIVTLISLSAPFALQPQGRA